MTNLGKIHYRPEIDGLRAIAVLAVVLFHAGFGCPGGFVGVDIFFVISGFLITSLIWKDLESGCFTFANFWERRARRIVPALVVVTMATLAAGWFLLLPADFKSLGRASASQAVFGANVHYWRDSGYFAGNADEKPLLHTWSLAVEEQFYLIVPFVLWAMFRTAKMRSRNVVLKVLAVSFVASFALSIHGVARHPNATFYLLPTRAWELLLGSLIAFLPSNPSLLAGRNRREFIALAGLALILVPVFTYTPKTPFPGIAALPPCLGAALLIWANGQVAGSVPTVAGALLANRPFVFIGLISYSLYLWHWPFLAFSKYSSLQGVTPSQRASMLGLGLLFAILSWKYVETPFRKRQLGVSRKSMFAFASAGLALVLGCGVLCMSKKGFPRRFPTPDFANAKTDCAFINELTIDDIRAERLIPIGASDSTLRPKVLVWGDSHAMAALPAVDAFLKEAGISGRAATHSATAPVLGWQGKGDRGLGTESIAYNDAVFTYIQSKKIPEVILIGHWGWYEDGLNTALLTTVRRLVETGCQPWVMLDVPAQYFDVPQALSSRIYSLATIESICSKPAALNELDQKEPNTVAEIEAAGGRVLDPKPRFLSSEGRYYIVHSKGVVLYRDANHLTTKGAKMMLLPLFRESLSIRNNRGWGLTARR